MAYSQKKRSTSEQFVEGTARGRDADKDSAKATDERFKKKKAVRDLNRWR